MRERKGRERREEDKSKNANLDRDCYIYVRVQKIYLRFGCHIIMLPIGDMICCRHFFAPVLVLGTFAERGAAPNRLVHSPPPPAARGT